MGVPTRKSSHGEFEVEKIAILLVEEILHQLRLVDYPMPRWCGISSINWFRISSINSKSLVEPPKNPNHVFYMQKLNFGTHDFPPIFQGTNFKVQNLISGFHLQKTPKAKSLQWLVGRSKNRIVFFNDIVTL